MPRMPTLFIQTLPSTVKLAGMTIACCATSLLMLGESGKVWNFSVRGSNFTIPPCSIMPCQMFPSLSIRSEEHTSELQSPCNLVCRLLLEKKKNNPQPQLIVMRTPALTTTHHKLAHPPHRAPK